MPTKLAKAAKWNQVVKEITVRSDSYHIFSFTCSYISPLTVYTSEYESSWVTEKIR